MSVFFPKIKTFDIIFDMKAMEAGTRNQMQKVRESWMPGSHVLHRRSSANAITLDGEISPNSRLMAGILLNEYIVCTYGSPACALSIETNLTCFRYKAKATLLVRCG